MSHDRATEDAQWFPLAWRYIRTRWSTACMAGRITLISFFYGSPALVGLGLLLVEVSRSLTHATFGRTPLGE